MLATESSPSTKNLVKLLATEEKRELIFSASSHVDT